MRIPVNYVPKVIDFLHAWTIILRTRPTDLLTVDSLFEPHLIVENILVVIQASDRLQEDRSPVAFLNILYSGKIVLTVRRAFFQLVEQVKDLHDARLIDLRLDFIHKVNRNRAHSAMVHDCALERKTAAGKNAVDVDATHSRLSSVLPRGIRDITATAEATRLTRQLLGNWGQMGQFRIHVLNSGWVWAVIG